ncbi:putative proteasome beta 2 subunit [Trypanosoma grayi]|uniref:putative proteasome beta 2 subunit n=1 Tax=Trypanosoma grayi TaxID=71804 RepID=UPI0004F45BAD|nr:putative proteasome beta 2 subunit [Trypanosoma grayi]KEG12208.1 putative proteasome beta 2 subunit [Trypanosoma grayi]
MSETTIAFRCNDFVLVAAAGLNAFYYIKITDTEDKVTQLDSHKVVACTGENGPRVNFVEYIKCNMALKKMREHGRLIKTSATASYMRNTLAGAIRSRDGAYLVNCLLAGYDVVASDDDDCTTGPHLYYLDYLGTMQEVPYGAHGYGASFVTAMLDRLWRPNLTAQEGADLMQKCCDEVKRRIVISNDKFICKAVTERGVELLQGVN